MTESISRRTLAKGAAWSVPVVGAAAAVTPASASPSTGGPGEACRTIGDKILEYRDTDLTTYSVGPNILMYGPGKTRVFVNVDEWMIPVPLRAKYNPSHFYANPGFCGTPCHQSLGQGLRDGVKGVTYDGTRFVGTKIYTSLVTCSPQAAGWGGKNTTTVFTDLPYRGSGLCTDKGWQIKGISIPYSIAYFRNALNPQFSVGPCCKYLNLTFPKKGCISNTLPEDKATSYRWSDKPLFG